MKVLMVIPSLGYGGAAKQLTLLARGLPRPQFEVCVCCLGGQAPWADVLRRAGLTVETVHWRRLVDPKPFLRLFGLLRNFQPDVVHVWQLTALRAVCLAGGGSRRIILSNAIAERKARLGKLDRWLLGKVCRIVVQAPSEAATLQCLGLPQERIISIAPGVEPSASEAPAPMPLRPMPAGSRLIACVGPIKPHKGFRDAVWAFDILRFLYDDLYGQIAGAESARSELQRFIVASECGERFFMVGPQPDVAQLLLRADIVWVPSLAPGGLNVALEAMAAGKPVVATRVPGLTEIVVDGETGFLVPPGDKVALARPTRVLLEDPDLRRRMGAAGRQRAREHFPSENLIKNFAHLYESIQPL